MIEKIERRIWFITLISILLYFGISIYSDLSAVIIAFQKFNWYFLPIIIIFVFMGYVLRTYRWIYYLKNLDIKIEKKMSILIFFSGLSMSVTPAKSGELVKSYLLKKTNKINVSRSAPIVFVERFTDLIGMVVLALFGFLSFKYGEQGLLISSLVLILFILLIQNQEVCEFSISFLAKLPKIGSKINFKEMYASSLSLLSAKPLVFGVLLSTVSWFLECCGFYFVLVGLDIEFSIIDATFIFAFSSIIGIATMLPGGLGTTEGSIIGLLILDGISKPSATAAAMLIRFCTLWFAVGIGLIALRYTTKNMPLDNKYKV